MKEIGALLLQKREAMNMSVEDVSEKTKIPVALLKALESGDIDYFKHDMSYVKYYLRSYCNAVNMDFEEVKDMLESSMNLYTQTMTIKKIEQQDVTEQGIREKSSTIRYTEKIKPRDMKPAKLDFSLISIILVILLLLGCIGFAFSYYITHRPATNKPERVVKEEVVEESSVEESSAVIEVEEVNTVSVEEIEADEYALVGFHENQQCAIVVEFNERTWVQVEIDGTKTQNPSSRIYEKGESIEINTEASNNRVIGIHLGYYKSNVFKINGEIFQLDEKIANKESGHKIKFIFKGEEE